MNNSIILLIIMITMIKLTSGRLFSKTITIEREVTLYLDNPCWSFYKKGKFPWSDRDACSEYYEHSFIRAVNKVGNCQPTSLRTKRQAGLIADAMTVAVTNLVSSAVVERGSQLKIYQHCCGNSARS